MGPGIGHVNGTREHRLSITAYPPLITAQLPGDYIS
ncbi:uncharacterized protein G2W53_010635 [Senna tora]|uniref:Uncharacterized protein n=1 Tax=Senna tora TaxID=362788 RepID=A0A834X085_9FABA|nr:uncharacterized protein G2W53_010635 [Senna tora]